jgi:hypothetical protein
VKDLIPALENHRFRLRQDATCMHGGGRIGSVRCHQWVAREWVMETLRFRGRQREGVHRGSREMAPWAHSSALR